MHGIEIDELIDEATAAAIHPVGAVSLRRVVELVRIPPMRWYIGDRVHAIDEIAPVALQGIGSGQDNRHPHDRDRIGAAPFHSAVPCLPSLSWPASPANNLSADAV